MGAYFLVALAKAARCAALFSSSDLLFHSTIPSSIFLAGVLSVAAAALLVLHPPWRGSAQRPPLSAQCRRHVVAHGASMACALALWAYGLTHCGPVRTLLLDYTEPFAVYLAAAAWRPSPATRAAGRAAVVLLLAYVLLVLTHGMHHHHHAVAAYRAARDAGGGPLSRLPPLPPPSSSPAPPLQEDQDGEDAGDEDALLDSPLQWSETLSGEVALVGAAALRALRRGASHGLASEVGGPRRLHALATTAAAALLLPLAAWAAARADADADAASRAAWDGGHAARVAAALALSALVLDHHVDANLHARLPAADAATLGLALSFGAACCLERLYDCPTVSWLTCACALLIGGATRVLLASQPSHAAQLAASAAQLPLVGRRLASRAHASGRATAAAVVRGVFASRDARRLAAFLLLNLLLMLVEAAVGALANSLALLSDAAHMLFDCAAIAIGLCGAYAARWPPSAAFPFGFARCEPLAAFANALLLLLAGVSVLAEAIVRLRAPQDVDEQLLLPVALAGLAVNLVGLAFFREHYTGGGGGGGGGGDNMRAVFLHVLADTMGSVGAVVSSLLIRWYGWTWADPLCSLLLALLIVATATPLLRRAAQPLLLAAPPSARGRRREQCLAAVAAAPGVAAVGDAKFWTHTASPPSHAHGGRAHGTHALLTVRVRDGESVAAVARTVEGMLRRHNVSHATVEAFAGALPEAAPTTALLEPAADGDVWVQVELPRSTNGCTASSPGPLGRSPRSPRRSYDAQPPSTFI